VNDLSIVNRGLAGLVAFITVNKEANDLARFVDGCVRNRGEIPVATLYIGTAYLIKALPDSCDAKDVAGESQTEEPVAKKAPSTTSTRCGRKRQVLEQLSKNRHITHHRYLTN
jgi:hypothetical protein